MITHKPIPNLTEKLMIQIKTTTTTREIVGEPEELLRLGFDVRHFSSAPEGQLDQLNVTAVANGVVTDVATDSPPSLDPFKQHVDFCLHVLRRIPIPNGQRELYRALEAAGDEGLLPNELAETMGRTMDQLAGVLGALGRRINGTPGVPPWKTAAIENFFRSGSLRYVMRPELQEALRIARLEGLM